MGILSNIFEEKLDVWISRSPKFQTDSYLRSDRDAPLGINAYYTGSIHISRQNYTILIAEQDIKVNTFTEGKILLKLIDTYDDLFIEIQAAELVGDGTYIMKYAKSRNVPSDLFYVWAKEDIEYHNKKG